MGRQYKTLTARVYLARLETLVEVHCVLTRECEPPGFTELGESEPFKGFFSTNPTEHSQKRLTKVVAKCSLWCSPGRGKGHCTLSPLPLSEAKASICQGTSNTHNQPKSTGENPLQVGGGDGGVGMDPLWEGKEYAWT